MTTASSSKKAPPSFLYRNSLSFALLLIFAGSFAGQAVMGWHVFNDRQEQYHQAVYTFGQYVASGHILSATFENWESEFLQMAVYVVLTIFLRQRGSSESKGCDGPEDVDRMPQPRPDAPWPVRKGGWYLAIYKHSLSIALLLLFFMSFVLHYTGSWIDYNYEQGLKGGTVVAYISYGGNSQFWFESFQNWQSEFLSIFVLIVLSIYLRQYGSPQSKPVDAPHDETGD